MSDELLPCPFCGSAPHLHQYASGVPKWGVSCENDLCGTIVEVRGMTREQVVTAWNTRPETWQPVEDYDEGALIAMTLRDDASWIGIRTGEDGSVLTVRLPDNIRLCKRGDA